MGMVAMVVELHYCIILLAKELHAILILHVTLPEGYALVAFV
jgi:hypothetical protein